MGISDKLINCIMSKRNSDEIIAEVHLANFCEQKINNSAGKGDPRDPQKVK